MIRRTNIFCLFLLAGLLPALLKAQDIKKENGDFISDIVKTFDVGSGGKLILRGVTGDVEIASWQKEIVEIREKQRLNVFTREEAQEIVERARSSYSVSGKTITIDSRGGGYWNQRQFRIFLPSKFDIDIGISQGDITAQNLNGYLNLRTSNGSITLIGAVGEVDIKTAAGDLHLENINGRLTASTSGGDVRLRNLSESADVRTAGGSIFLSSAKKDAELRTSGGEITIEKVGGNLLANTSGGDIRVTDCSGEAELHTSGGDIDVRGIGGRMDAVTSGGDITGQNVGGPVIARTSGGDIELRDVRGAVRANTSAGDVELSLTLKDFKKDHRIHLQTNSGTIRLYIPDKLPAAITATIYDAGGRWKRYDIYSDFPLSKEEENQRSVLRRTGDINGGGDEIILETSNGDIYIRKLK